AVNDVMRADGTALASLNVIANDTDPDGDKLTVTIEESAPIGTATANADGTVRLDALPGDFKGVTRFKYRVTDAGGLTSSATAVVFTGGDPFRVVFAGDAIANGSYELYLLDLLSSPVQLTNATDGALRLTGFSASTNGTTVAYSRASTTTPTTTDLSFVRTATPKQDVRIAFPAGATLAPDAQGRNQFAVSSDGQWIAAIARDGTGIEAAYVLNVASPTTVSKVNIPGAVRASLPKFSNDSQRLFLLASPATNDANDDLFTVSLNGLTVTQLSQPTAVNSNDDVLDYSVASDQSRILLRANRAGRVGLFYINPAQLQTESKVSHNLDLTETVRETTVDQPPGAGGSILTQRVGYTVESNEGFKTWLAEVSATPNPHVVAASGARLSPR
ncbi:MAG TPA: Ig-like domain-containing protein, partial [Vicinamibacterales bacterium]|nr:Ig-like domain-containing protein [Vicinamibacterales bacterium]